jgi:hypothetical protein
VNGNFAVWMKCRSGSCNVFRYDLTTRATTRMPQSREVQYGPSVTPTGTTYYGRSGPECGSAAELVKTTLDGTTVVLYAFPADEDFAVTYATTVLTKPPTDIGVTRIYFDRGICSTGQLDIYSIDDIERLPPSGRG